MNQRAIILAILSAALLIAGAIVFHAPRHEGVPFFMWLGAFFAGLLALSIPPVSTIVLDNRSAIADPRDDA